jgi:hypothetical protein
MKELSMKSWLGAFASLACMLVLAGSALAQGGELVGAEWGVPGRKVDVTSRVRTFVHDGVLQLEVTRFNLGIDPAPHENKVLTIRLREWDGDIKDYSYPERSVVRLELDQQDWHARREEHEHHEREERRAEGYQRDYEHHERRLEILRAYYGAEGQFANVTDAVRSRIDGGGRLYLRVDNYSMGVDPLPGVHKRLRILYTIGGERRNIVVDEKTDVQLP